MRPLVLSLMLVVVLLAPVVAQAQEDDGWGEITGLMNGITGINQQLADAGVQWIPGQTRSGSRYVDSLAYWAQMYAQLLGAVDQAFAEGTVTGPVAPRAMAAPRDPFDPRVADVLRRQLWQMQMMQPDVMQAYRNNLLFQMNQE